MYVRSGITPGRKVAQQLRLPVGAWYTRLCQPLNGSMLFDAREAICCKPERCLNIEELLFKVTLLRHASKLTASKLTAQSLCFTPSVTHSSEHLFEKTKHPCICASKLTPTNKHSRAFRTHSECAICRSAAPPPHLPCLLPSTNGCRRMPHRLSLSFSLSLTLSPLLKP